MDVAEKWFKEAIVSCPVHETKNEFFIIKRGFRLSKDKDSDYYRALDARKYEFYSEIEGVDYNQLIDKGFIKGVDHIGFERDTKEVFKLKRLVELLYSRKKKFKKLIKKDRRLNEKRIRNLYKNIDIYIDLIFLYESRIKQFNNKYNKK